MARRAPSSDVTSHPLLALAAALILTVAACATTPPSNATTSTPPPSTAALGPIPVYTLDGAEHRRPAAIDWHAESRTFFVSTHNDGSIYRGELDSPITPIFLHGQPGQEADGIRVVGGRIYIGGGRTIVPITGATVPLATGMALDGNRLVIADDAGLSVVELGDDAGDATLVEQIRDPSFRSTAAVAVAGDRYLVANLADQGPPPDTVSSVPARR